MKKILFSPIGMTDPITNLHDGSMLHICRVYKPDKIILYMSKEVLVYHEKDNRYVYCIEQLSQKLNHPIEILYAKRPELDNVQDYDIFYADFYCIIEDVFRNMEVEDKLFVNIASGTPAMKSALLILSVLTKYHVKPIQVSTPKKKSNIKSEDRNNYNVQKNWELNEDNKENFINRCMEPKIQNLSTLIMKDTIYDKTETITTSEISLFYGIRVSMYYNDHMPPHFYAEYNGNKALVDIVNIQVIKGVLPNKQLKLILAWCVIHQDELMQNWELAKEMKPLNRINPLI